MKNAKQMYNNLLKNRQAYAALAVNEKSSLKSLSISCVPGLIPNTQINRSSIYKTSHSLKKTTNYAILFTVIIGMLAHFFQHILFA